jgi:hypothetical protein
MDKKPQKSRSGSMKQPEPNPNVRHFASPTPQRRAVHYPKDSIVYSSSKVVSGNSVEHKQQSPRRRS